MRARHRAGDLTDALARLTPPFADRRRADGALERVGIQELAVGDRVHVEEGGRLPADGVLLSERCRVDEALLSGESAPLTRRRGEPLIAGSVLLDGPIQMRVERVGAETMLAGIAALVARAQAQRPQLARAGERAARSFVARVLALTALTGAAWSVFDPSRAFSAALAVLVVSCPCAFALAVPAAITRALAVLARCGVLVVKPDAIQALAEATHVVFDKTGTLTEPELALADVETFGGVSRDAALTSRCVARTRESSSGRARHRCCSWRWFGRAGKRCDVARGARHQRHGCADANCASVKLRSRLRIVSSRSFDQAEASAPRRRLARRRAGPIAAFRLRERLRPGARAAMDALRAERTETADRKRRCADQGCGRCG